MSKGEREQSSYIHKIAIRLTDETCSAQARPAASHANRARGTLLLLPDFALEVFGFLDRAYVGPSLLAARCLHDLVGQLKQRLPVHHLTCALENEVGPGYIKEFTGAYILAVRHTQLDLSYTDVRRFKMPSTAGPESDCALMRYYLSNSHVADLRAPQAEFLRFTIKMLASLAARNFSVGRIDLCAEAQRLSDYRSLDVIFGGLRMNELHLSCDEHRFVELVKTTDFFRMSKVQGLRQLRLELSLPWKEEDKPRGHARSRSPLWVSGICLLHSCKFYRVEYASNRHLRSISRKMVQICEEFERGNISDIVEHFEFKLNSSKEVHFAFSRANLLVAGMKIEGKRHWDSYYDIEWDVYRFRNASTGGYLTACVGRMISVHDNILHLVKGEVYPDASFDHYLDF